MENKKSIDSVADNKYLKDKKIITAIHILTEDDISEVLKNCIEKVWSIIQPVHFNNAMASAMGTLSNFENDMSILNEHFNDVLISAETIIGYIDRHHLLIQKILLLQCDNKLCKCFTKLSTETEGFFVYFKCLLTELYHSIDSVKQLFVKVFDKPQGKWSGEAKGILSWLKLGKFTYISLLDNTVNSIVVAPSSSVKLNEIDIFSNTKSIIFLINNQDNYKLNPFIGENFPACNKESIESLFSKVYSKFTEFLSCTFAIQSKLSPHITHLENPACSSSLEMLLTLLEEFVTLHPQMKGGDNYLSSNSIVHGIQHKSMLKIT